VKNLPIRLLRLARDDLRDAHLWYDLREPALGFEFVQEVVRTLRKAAAEPSLYRIVDSSGVRRVLLKRFPYLALFRVENDQVVVYAILHTKRSDRSWRRRLK
jgi:toxin ParE1/3/4